MNPKIQKVNLQNLDDMQISFSASNPFENLEYFQAMEVSDSASAKTGWIPNHLGELENGKLIKHGICDNFGWFGFNDKFWKSEIEYLGIGTEIYFKILFYVDNYRSRCKAEFHENCTYHQSHQ